MTSSYNLSWTCFPRAAWQTWLKVLRIKKPLCFSLIEDTLSRGVADVVSRGSCAGHPHRVGELREQLQAEVFKPLVLFASVDEHLVLQWTHVIQQMKWSKKLELWWRSFSIMYERCSCSAPWQVGIHPDILLCHQKANNLYRHYCTLPWEMFENPAHKHRHMKASLSLYLLKLVIIFLPWGKKGIQGHNILQQSTPAVAASHAWYFHRTWLVFSVTEQKGDHMAAVHIQFLVISLLMVEKWNF